MKLKHFALATLHYIIVTLLVHLFKIMQDDAFNYTDMELICVGVAVIGSAVLCGNHLVQLVFTKEDLESVYPE